MCGGDLEDCRKSEEKFPGPRRVPWENSNKCKENIAREDQIRLISGKPQEKTGPEDTMAEWKRKTKSVCQKNFGHC